MSPGNHQKSGHCLGKTGCVQGTLVLDYEPHTIYKETYLLLHFHLRLGEGWATSGSPCTVLSSGLQRPQIPSSHGHDIRWIQARNDKIRLDKGSVPGVGCNGSRNYGKTLCIPGDYFKCKTQV